MPKRTILAAVVTVGVFAILVVATRLGPAEPPSSSPASAPAAAGSASASPTPTTEWSPPLAVTVTRDADRYAASVAELVFGMDTRTLDPGDYRAALLAAADPALSSTGRADLVRTVEERIPTADMWASMRANDQYSTWATTQVSEPGTWAQVVTSGQAQPGWVMRNVTGIQDTHYLDAGVPKTATRERTLTIGMRCPAPGLDLDQCHLLLVGTTVLP